MRAITTVCLVFVCLSTGAQTIELHSITTRRQPSGDGGYTFDGDKMADSRAKLLNPASFGQNGIYAKTISISDGYELSGSLTEVTRLPAHDLFFFGFFNKLDQSIEPFTSDEVDSLYYWSKRGGKVIITSGLGLGALYSSNMLNAKWGYKTFTTIDPASPTGNEDEGIIPEVSVIYSDLWTGPFGNAPGFYQAGSLQGYFSKIPPNSVILGTTIAENKPAVLMDCETLDLLIVDTDVYTTYPGTVSKGADIQNNNDKFLANTIVFMDKLQDPPILVKNGGQLSVNSNYLDYNWYHNGELIPGAKGNTINYTEDGSYQVEVKVNGGCKIRSDDFVFEPECEIFVPTAFSPDYNGSNDKACVYSACLEDIDFKIFDRWGEMIFQSKEPGKCWDGIYKGAKANTGVYAWTLNAKRKSGTEISKKGNITLIR
ncbi:MAG TPA: gliding motility-associated C-terminal domain-containing protein [Bacteroidia bacterium]|nr:gliding motility-associated C-terminal domain-containing protein [Bacteroidia bacterium]